ncbi:MAG: hypothetical protein ACYTEO_13420 [Planctomycetota bacterium]|jgi:hypothetical protein
MLGVACHYSAEQHTLLKPELLKWCIDNTGDKQLFVYRQNQVGTFVIGRWLDHPRRWFVDVLNLGHSLSNFTRELAQELVRRITRPITAEATSRRLRETASDQRHTWEHPNESVKQQTMEDLFSTKVSVSMSGAKSPGVKKK